MADIGTIKKNLFELLSFKKKGIEEYIDDLKIPSKERFVWDGGREIKLKHRIVCDGCSRYVIFTTSSDDKNHYCETCENLVKEYGPMERWTESILLKIIDTYEEKKAFIKSIH